MKLHERIRQLVDGVPDEMSVGLAPAAIWRRWLEEDERERRESPERPELVNQTAAAELAGVSTRTIRDWEAAGRITNHGREGAPLYDASELPRRRRKRPPAGPYNPGADAADIVGEIG